MRETNPTMPGLPGGPAFDVRPNETDDIAAEVRLSRSITLQDGRTVHVISFREPTMRDALDCGEITKAVTRDIAAGVTRSVVVERDAVAIERWFCRLTRLPSSVFPKITARDGRQIIATIIELAGDLDMGNLNASQPTF